MSEKRPVRQLHPPSSNRCCQCGRYVGDTFTGYTQDKFSKRGLIYCEPCLAVELLEVAR